MFGASGPQLCGCFHHPPPTASQRLGSLRPGVRPLTDPAPALAKPCAPDTSHVPPGTQTCTCFREGRAGDGGCGSGSGFGVPAPAAKCSSHPLWPLLPSQSQLLVSSVLSLTDAPPGIHLSLSVPLEDLAGVTRNNPPMVKSALQQPESLLGSPKSHLPCNQTDSRVSG